MPLASLDPQKVKRVLLLNFTALGDLLFSTPAIRALKETYPNWRLDLLVKPPFGPLMEHNPQVDRLWLYPGRGPGLIKLMRQLENKGFGLAIILHGNDPEATLLAYASRSPFIIGSAKSPLAFAYSARLEQSDPYQHAIERRLDFVRLVGADTRDKRMQLFLPSEEEARAEAIVSQHFGEASPLLMALHSTGSGAYKWWPRESFAALGKYLFETYQAPLLIISGTEDRPMAEALAAQLPGPTLVTGGRFSLRTVAALLKRARLLVANDSGPLHLALALGVPSLLLLGADHPARIGPYQVEWGAYLHKREEICEIHPCRLVKCQDNVCLKAITVDEVLQVVREWWEPRYYQRPDNG